MGKIPFFSKKKTSETDTGKEIFHCEVRKQELITWANKTIITKEMVVGQNGS